MKQRFQFPPCQTGSCRGMALILVLAAVAFVSILTVAFLLSVNHELVSSKNYASGASARVYADAAVNLVIGQLQAGTTQNDPTKTWVSQPGLIRLFNNTGSMVSAYKLYSSSKMVVGSTFTPLTSTGDPSDVPTWDSSTASNSLPWELYPNVYDDLNSPVTVNSVTKYPILNPGGLNAATQIEGFSVASMVSSNSALTNQVPMPVSWIYVLTDGRFATAQTNPPDPTAVTLFTPDGNAVAANNPPVARIAFWTDDDTCRLNINTASEGNYWTVPFDEVGGDHSLGICQVNSNEFQRYPGHPATTSLSPVFDFLTNSGASTTDLRNFIFALTPRVAGRGSQFGARYIGYAMPVNLDNDRLYTSVDELLFLPKVNTATGARYTTTTQNIQTYDANQLDWTFTGGSFSTTGTPYQFSTNFSLDPDRLELARFFITANSRAPEVTLFGTPRLSLWPVDTRSNYQSVYDQLLAFSSTLGGYPYYFQRQNPNSTTDDYNKIPRNQLLLPYLDHLTSTTIPGYGGNFSTKYATDDREQLLTSIFDWIRTVNLAYRDTAGVVQPYDWYTNSVASVGAIIPPGTPGSGQVLPIQITSQGVSTQGYGRFPTLSKAALGIIREAELTDTPTAGQTTIQYRVVYLMETYVPLLGYAAYIPNYHIQVSGLANGFNLVTTDPSTTGSITQAISFQDGDIHVTAPSNFETYTGRSWGGTQGFNNLFAYSDSSNNYQLTARTIGSTDQDTGYPFVSGLLSVVCPTTDKHNIKVGITPTGINTVTVKFYDSTDTQSIATYTTPFSAFGPLSGAFLANPSSTATASAGTGTGTSDMLPDLQGRVNQMVVAGNIYTGGELDWTQYKNVFGPPDIVRGMELNHGDLRLSAIQGTDSYSKFVTNKYYTNTAYPQAHALLGPNGNCYATDYAYTTNSVGTTRYVPRGVLVSGTSGTFNPSATSKTLGSQAGFVPQAPSAMGAATSVTGVYSSSPGDFSTGIGSEGDGPHIMKADEGNVSFGGMDWGQSTIFPYQNQFFPYNSALSSAFSPNREVASAVQLGTLPSQPKTPVPWQTLLFRPDFFGNHSTASPADYLLLDLFWMPVTDPYPISETLSTAGKVNMNYQIVPFTYITRSTAMIGALKSTKIAAMPVEQALYYKLTGWTANKTEGGADHINYSYLYAIDPVKTLLFFSDKFSGTDPSNNIFKSASEICSIPLVPVQTVANLINTGYPASPPDTTLHSVNVYGATDAATLRTEINKFWSYNTLTGDNIMEAPYNSLYPRLTTQSNTYTVYVDAQALQVTGSSGGGTFTGIQNKVSAEYRGSYEVERYIDLNNTAIPDFADPSNYSKTIYPYYKFRILSNKQFIP